MRTTTAMVFLRTVSVAQIRVHCGPSARPSATLRLAMEELTGTVATLNMVNGYTPRSLSGCHQEVQQQGGRRFGHLVQQTRIQLLVLLHNA